MTGLLRAVPLWAWLLAASALAGGLGWLRLDAVTAQRDAALAQVETAEARAAVLQSALDYRRAETQRLNAALAEREESLAEASEEIQAKRDALAQLERNDAAIRTWSDELVPDAVRSWVRNLGADTGADHLDAERAGAPADTAAGTDGNG